MLYTSKTNNFFQRYFCERIQNQELMVVSTKSLPFEKINIDRGRHLIYVGSEFT